MKPEDDPEARIRELERPLADLAQTSELGAEHHSSGGAYIPPPVPAYNAPDYGIPTYGAPPQYGTAQPYGTGYPAAPRKVSGGISWLVFGLIAAVLVAIAAGVIVFTTKMSGFTIDEPGVSGGGGSIDIPAVPEPSVVAPSIPSVPGMPSFPGMPSDPGVITLPPGGQASVAGVDNNKTVVCNDGTVNVSGVRNTVNITGHCIDVTVSGMNNVVTVDVADAINASGFDNRVTFHSGSPQINSGGSNVVEQG